MNVSILGVIPWRELAQSGASNSKLYVVSTLMQRVYGHGAGAVISVLVMWTAFASVFSLTLGYSRVPYAAALDGNYFRAFARVHPVHQFPYVSLLALAGVAALFCFLRLADLIAALVVIRIILQFLVQSIGVIVLRIRRPDMPRPFRMWLYPLPALMAAASFVFILVSRKGFLREIRYAAVILVVGIVIYSAGMAAGRVAVWGVGRWSLVVSGSLLVVRCSLAMASFMKWLTIAVVICATWSLATAQDFPLKRIPLLTYVIDYEASWSPDGKKIVLISSRHGGLKVHVLDAAGGGDGSNMQQLTSGADEDDSPAWSPDGRNIAFVSVRGAFLTSL